MSDRTLLRTCTYKSILGFGDLDQRMLTIYELLGLCKHYELVCVYYRMGKVSFTDEILEEIGVTKDMRIVKPGKDHDAWRKNWKQAKDNVMNRDKNYKGMARKIGYRSKQYARIDFSKSDKREYGKRSLWLKNHGH